MHGTEAGLVVDGRPGLGCDEVEDRVEVERARHAREPEQLVRVAVDQHQRVRTNVVEGMRGRAGDLSLEQKTASSAARGSGRGSQRSSSEGRRRTWRPMTSVVGSGAGIGT